MPARPPARVMPSPRGAKTPRNGDMSKDKQGMPKEANVLQGLDIDENKLEFVMEQIAEQLSSNKVRVKDLFMQFDDDNVRALVLWTLKRSFWARSGQRSHFCMHACLTTWSLTIALDLHSRGSSLAKSLSRPWSSLAWRRPMRP